MKAKILFGAVVVFLIAMAFKPAHKVDFSKADALAAKMSEGFVPELEAQAPQPGSGNVVLAYATSTGGGAQTMLAAPNKQARNYIVKAQCVNTSATTTAVLVKDNGTGNVLFPVACPAASQSTIDFPTPIQQPTVNATITMTPVAGETTLYFFIEGFTAR